MTCDGRARIACTCHARMRREGERVADDRSRKECHLPSGLGHQHRSMDKRRVGARIRCLYEQDAWPRLSLGSGNLSSIPPGERGVRDGPEIAGSMSDMRSARANSEELRQATPRRRGVRSGAQALDQSLFSARRPIAAAQGHIRRHQHPATPSRTSRQCRRDRRRARTLAAKASVPPAARYRQRDGMAIMS